MNTQLARATLALLVGTAPLVTACGDDGDGGGDGESGGASQAVVDACDPVSTRLAELAADCGNYPASGFQAPCESEGAEAEAAGCLDEYVAEQACLEAQVTADACSCGESGFLCTNLPCTEEEDTRRACVKGG